MFPDRHPVPVPPEVLEDERYDRQQRIPGWNQEALAAAWVGVVGDDPWLTGLYVTAAAALGIGRLTVVAPSLEPRLLTAARGLQEHLKLTLFPGFFSHPLLEDLLAECRLLVDLSHFALATKILLEMARRQHLPLVRGYLSPDGGRGRLRLFTYMRGREWRELQELVPAAQLPSPWRGDPVLAVILSGLALEETKKLLFREPVTPEVVKYPPEAEPAAGAGAPGSLPADLPLAVVGAGALGNFVALGLAALGFSSLTVFDPELVEITNLNRQILFWDAVGRPKAQALAEKLETWFGLRVRAVTAPVTRQTSLRGFFAVFDCTDNFESRIVLSEKCRAEGPLLISGGTGAEAGQVVSYAPAQGGPTPAELLGLYDLVGQRDPEIPARPRASCLYVPEPAVIMTNQIVAGVMVDSFRRLLSGEPVRPVFYQAKSPAML